MSIPIDTEVQPFLPQHEIAPHEERFLEILPLDVSEDIGISRSQAWKLYTSHFFSTWNARTYEFAAIIFTASAYPDTLFASSLRGLITTAASICFSSSIGRWIDTSSDRLRMLSTTINCNRASIICATLLWYFLVQNSHAESTSGEDHAVRDPVLKGVLFGAILVIGIAESLSGFANTISMERDWVVCLASPAGQSYDLTQLNAVMRRIDLTCKLVAPISISVSMTAMGVNFGVALVGTMSLVSWAVEIWCARRVWSSNALLRIPKHHSSSTTSPADDSIVNARPTTFIRSYISDFKVYLSTQVCIPSLSLSLLHLSALSYSAIFITYLLSAGFSLNLITSARAVGSVVEISSTFLTAFGVQYLGKASVHGGHMLSPTSFHENEETIAFLPDDSDMPHQLRVETGLERLGLWGITWQLTNLIPVALILWSIRPISDVLLFGAEISQPHMYQAIPLFAFLSLSRLGLWIFDLATQQLTQTFVAPMYRSRFAGVEYSVSSLAQFLSFGMALVWHRPEDFRWIVVGSISAVLVAAGMYAAWIRKVRGHLVHGVCGSGCRGKK